MKPTVAVAGVGASGARAARQLASSDECGQVLLSGHGDRPKAMQRALGARARLADPLEATGAVVLAGPCHTQLDLARDAVAAGCHVVSTSDAVDDVESLLDLGPEAERRGVTVIAGAAFSPGLSCVLAAHASSWMDHVDEIHVARFGTGGPACAHQHHEALSSRTADWRDGQWFRRPGGSGRELCVFPDPVGSVDCYRAGLPDAILLHRAFPEAERITARQAANRRQRLTAWLPMLRRPHPEGRMGAIRVELRGRRGTTTVTEVTGAIDRPAVAAGAVAGLVTRRVVAGAYPPGAHGLASVVDPVPFLGSLADLGVRAAVFVGTS